MRIKRNGRNAVRTAVCLLLAGLLLLPAAAGAEGFLESPDAIGGALSSVLKLTVRNGDGKSISYASGFVMFDGTALVTSAHAVRNAVSILAESDAGEQYGISSVYAADETRDLAILCLTVPAGGTAPQPLSAAEEDPLRGAHVLAAGSPKGIKNVVTDGIVSAVYEEDGVGTVLFTAPVSYGASGGPVFDGDGRVIGVIRGSGIDGSGSGVNFAVSVREAAELWEARGEPQPLAALYHAEEIEPASLALPEEEAEASPAAETQDGGAETASDGSGTNGSEAAGLPESAAAADESDGGAENASDGNTTSDSEAAERAESAPAADESDGGAETASDGSGTNGSEAAGLPESAASAETDEERTEAETRASGGAEEGLPLPAVKLLLDRAEITLLINAPVSGMDTARLNAELLPRNAERTEITFASDKPSVVSVGENGVLTAVAKGTARITAAAAGSGEPLTAVCRVTVREAVSEISNVNPDNTVGVGRRLRLEAEALPKTASDRGLAWTSDNPAIAAVSANGTVTGKSAGTCRVLCTARDGGGAYTVFTVHVVGP